MAASNAGPDRFLRVEELFHAALAVDPERRASFLRDHCAGDESLFAEVLRLLEADESDSRTRDPLAPLAESMRVSAVGVFSERDESIVSGARIGAWRLERLLGEGGMGTVWLATRADAAFEMKAAIKLLRENRLDRKSAARFELERSALARLEHPGIARLLDGGATESGMPWLAMELVEGERIDRAADRRRSAIDQRVDWMIEVCAAVDHAHRRLIVHRDLKPSNVLIDSEDRARLLDFGIAKLLERADDPPPAHPVELTAPDERVLTPRYASPEQVRGEAVGIASDVYSLGVLLHELLCGRSPYHGDTDSRYALEKAVCEAEPLRPSAAVLARETSVDSPESIAAARGTSVERLVTSLRGDLDHIVLHCLEKDPERRYASAAQLAADLRRYRDGQPVHARGDSLGYRVAKFVRRNPAVALISAVLLVTILVAFATHLRAARRNAELVARILPLADLKIARDLEDEAASLWPMRPERADHFRDWLARARALLARRPAHESGLASLGELGLDADQRAWLAGAISDLLVEYSRLEAADPNGDTVAGVEHRLARSLELAESSLARADLAAEWRSALDDLADSTRSPRYGGLRLEPQLGLVPLGRDPESGLHEFWHVPSGARPSRDESGRLEITPECGIVLVLLPGGEATLGAQDQDPAAPHYDPAARSEEGPPRRAAIEPFFLGKYEVTQAQWGRITGAFPSAYPPGSIFGAQTTSLRNPVEQVHQLDAVAGLARVDLVLPTEDQWEYGCRAGTATPFFTGSDADSLAGAANFADRFARENGGSSNWQYSDAIDDGATIHTAVGSYRANGFGLHDVHGNVWEWCADEIRDRENKDRVSRGGGFFNPPAMLRASNRYFSPRDFRSHSLGMRAARRVE